MEKRRSSRGRSTLLRADEIKEEEPDIEQEPDQSQPRRSVGRPRKNIKVEEPDTSQPRRSRGRPRKNILAASARSQSSCEEPSHVEPRRGPGRPRKPQIARSQSVEPIRRPVGRPRKNNLGNTVPIRIPSQGGSQDQAVTPVVGNGSIKVEEPNSSETPCPVGRPPKRNLGKSVTIQIPNEEQSNQEDSEGSEMEMEDPFEPRVSRSLSRSRQKGVTFQTEVDPGQVRSTRSQSRSRQSPPRDIGLNHLERDDSNRAGTSSSQSQIRQMTPQEPVRHRLSPIRQKNPAEGVSNQLQRGQSVPRDFRRLQSPTGQRNAGEIEKKQIKKEQEPAQLRSTRSQSRVRQSLPESVREQSTQRELRHLQSPSRVASSGESAESSAKREETVPLRSTRSQSQVSRETPKESKVDRKIEQSVPRESPSLQSSSGQTNAGIARNPIQKEVEPAQLRSTRSQSSVRQSLPTRFGGIQTETDVPIQMESPSPQRQSKAVPEDSVGEKSTRRESPHLETVPLWSTRSQSQVPRETQKESKIDRKTEQSVPRASARLQSPSARSNAGEIARDQIQKEVEPAHLRSTRSQSRVRQSLPAVFAKNQADVEELDQMESPRPEQQQKIVPEESVREQSTKRELSHPQSSSRVANPEESAESPVEKKETVQLRSTRSQSQFPRETPQEFKMDRKAEQSVPRKSPSLQSSSGQTNAETARKPIQKEVEPAQLRSTRSQIRVRQSLPVETQSRVANPGESAESPVEKEETVLLVRQKTPEDIEMNGKTQSRSNNEEESVKNPSIQMESPPRQGIPVEPTETQIQTLSEKESRSTKQENSEQNQIQGEEVAQLSSSHQNPPAMIGGTKLEIDESAKSESPSSENQMQEKTSEEDALNEESRSRSTEPATEDSIQMEPAQSPSQLGQTISKESEQVEMHIDQPEIPKDSPHSQKPCQTDPRELERTKKLVQTESPNVPCQSFPEVVEENQLVTEDPLQSHQIIPEGSEQVEQLVPEESERSDSQSDQSILNDLDKKLEELKKSMKNQSQCSQSVKSQVKMPRLMPSWARTPFPRQQHHQCPIQRASEPIQMRVKQPMVPKASPRAESHSGVETVRDWVNRQVEKQISLQLQSTRSQSHSRQFLPETVRGFQSAVVPSRAQSEIRQKAPEESVSMNHSSQTHTKESLRSRQMQKAEPIQMRSTGAQNLPCQSAPKELSRSPPCQTSPGESVCNKSQKLKSVQLLPTRSKSQPLQVLPVVLDESIPTGSPGFPCQETSQEPVIHPMTQSLVTSQEGSVVSQQDAESVQMRSTGAQSLLRQSAPKESPRSPPCETSPGESVCSKSLKQESVQLLPTRSENQLLHPPPTEVAEHQLKMDESIPTGSTCTQSPKTSEEPVLHPMIQSLVTSQEGSVASQQDAEPVQIQSAGSQSRSPQALPEVVADNKLETEDSIQMESPRSDHQTIPEDSLLNQLLREQAVSRESPSEFVVVNPGESVKSQDQEEEENSVQLQSSPSQNYSIQVFPEVSSLTQSRETFQKALGRSKVERKRSMPRDSSPCQSRTHQFLPGVFEGNQVQIMESIQSEPPLPSRRTIPRILRRNRKERENSESKRLGSSPTVSENTQMELSVPMESARSSRQTTPKESTEPRSTRSPSQSSLTQCSTEIQSSSDSLDGISDLLMKPSKPSLEQAEPIDETHKPTSVASFLSSENAYEFYGWKGDGSPPRELDLSNIYLTDKPNEGPSTSKAHCDDMLPLGDFDSGYMSSSVLRSLLLQNRPSTQFYMPEYNYTPIDPSDYYLDGDSQEPDFDSREYTPPPVLEREEPFVDHEEKPVEDAESSAENAEPSEEKSEVVAVPEVVDVKQGKKRRTKRATKEPTPVVQGVRKSKRLNNWNVNENENGEDADEEVILKDFPHFDRGIDVPIGLVRKPFRFNEEFLRQKFSIESRVEKQLEIKMETNSLAPAPKRKRGNDGSWIEVEERPKKKEVVWKMVTVGEDHQAEVPSVEEMCPEENNYEDEDREETFWEPNEMPTDSIKDFDVTLQTKYWRAIHLQYKGHIPYEFALKTLMEANYDFCKALDSIEKCLLVLPQRMKPIGRGQARLLAQLLKHEKKEDLHIRDIQEIAMRNYHIAEIVPFVYQFKRFYSEHEGKVPCNCMEMHCQQVDFEPKHGCTNCTRKLRNVEYDPEKLCLICKTYTFLSPNGARRPAENPLFTHEEMDLIAHWKTLEKEMDHVNADIVRRQNLETKIHRWRNFVFSPEEADMLEWTLYEQVSPENQPKLSEKEREICGLKCKDQLVSFELPLFTRCGCRRSGDIPRLSPNVSKFTFTEEEKIRYRKAILRYKGNQTLAGYKLGVEPELVERFVNKYPSGSALYKGKAFEMMRRPKMSHTDLPEPIPPPFKKKSLEEQQDPTYVPEEKPKSAKNPRKRDGDAEKPGPVKKAKSSL